MRSFANASRHRQRAHHQLLQTHLLVFTSVGHLKPSSDLPLMTIRCRVSQALTESKRGKPPVPDRNSHPYKEISKDCRHSRKSDSVFPC
jgi:hypothetical protein